MLWLMSSSRSARNWTVQQRQKAKRKFEVKLREEEGTDGTIEGDMHAETCLALRLVLFQDCKHCHANWNIAPYLATSNVICVQRFSPMAYSCTEVG